MILEITISSVRKRILLEWLKIVLGLIVFAFGAGLVMQLVYMITVLNLASCSIVEWLRFQNFLLQEKLKFLIFFYAILQEIFSLIYFAPQIII